MRRIFWGSLGGMRFPELVCFDHTTAHPKQFCTGMVPPQPQHGPILAGGWVMLWVRTWIKFGPKPDSCFGPKPDSGFGPKHDSGFDAKPDSGFGPKHESCFGPKHDSCSGAKRRSCFCSKVNASRQRGVAMPWSPHFYNQTGPEKTTRPARKRQRAPIFFFPAGSIC